MENLATAGGFPKEIQVRVIAGVLGFPIPNLRRCLGPPEGVGELGTSQDSWDLEGKGQGIHMSAGGNGVSKGYSRKLYLSFFC